MTHLGLRQEALTALDKARQHTVELAGETPDDVKYRKRLALNDLNRAATLHSMGRLDEAERLARGAQQRWDQLAKEAPSLDTGWELALNVSRSDGLLAAVLMDKGELDDALDCADKALGRCSALQLDGRDHRGLTRVIANLTELLGQIHATAGRRWQRPVVTVGRSQCGVGPCVICLVDDESMGF